MIITIQYIGMPFSESVTDSVIRKLEELSDKHEMVRKARVLIKYRNSAAGEGAFYEIELHLSDSMIHAGTLAKNFEIAVMETIWKLKKELLKKSFSESTFEIQNRFSEPAL